MVEAGFKLSNALNYEITPAKILLQPRQETLVKVKFTPTHFDFAETAELTISTQEIGDWRFYLAGRG